MGRISPQVDRVDAGKHARSRHLGERVLVGGDHPAAARRHARHGGHVPSGATAGPQRRASLRRGIRHGVERAARQPAPELHLLRLGGGVPGRARGALSGLYERREPRPRLARARLSARQRGVRLSSAPAGAGPPAAGASAHFRTFADIHVPGLPRLSRGARRGSLSPDPRRPAAGGVPAQVRRRATPRWLPPALFINSRVQARPCAGRTPRSACRSRGRTGRSGRRPRGTRAA